MQSFVLSDSENKGLQASGQRLTVDGRKPSAVDAPALNKVTAWRQGLLILHDEPLAQVKERCNRSRATSAGADPLATTRRIRASRPAVRGWRMAS